MSKPLAIFQRSIDVQYYIASANVANFKLPKSGSFVPDGEIWKDEIFIRFPDVI